MRGPSGRGIGVWVVVLITLVALVATLQMGRDQHEEISYTELVTKVRAGDVASIEITGDESRAIVEPVDDGPSYVVMKEVGAESFWMQVGLASDDFDDSWTYGVQKSSGFGDFVPLLSTIVPFALMLGFLVFMMRQAQAGNNQAMSFGRSRARLMTGDTPTVTFQDVAGVEEAKQELSEVVEFLQEPEKFIALGAEIPKGVLMVGPPGCGKTLMARAVAGEAGVPFFTISGSEFVEMFVGVGASRVRDLFEQAKKHSPCIVFIDEIDAVGRQRGAGLGGSHDEREQTLNQVLVEMDGFDTDTNVIVMAATNRPDILDPALLRPGRFDRRIVVDRPDMRGRQAILEIHMEGKPVSDDVAVDVVAKATPGLSGADLENLVNEAAILAARRDSRRIEMVDFEEATDKVRLGPERRSRVAPMRELEIVAYHEAGHAMVRHYLEDTDPIHKITIVPRGMAAGMVSSLPEDDRYLYSRSRFHSDLAAALGGRAAEEIVFGEVSTGAASDLEEVTRTARDMVTRYGMSEVLGPLTFGDRHELVFLGRDINETRNYSEDVARQIDMEIRRFVNDAYDRARDILSEHVDRLHVVASKLLEVETLDRKEFEAVLAGAEAAPVTT